MRNRIHHLALSLLAAGSVALTACGGHDVKNASTMAGGDVSASPNAMPASTPSATTPMAMDTARRAHHSKLGGALAGAAAGHMLGGHAVAGAAVGALVQHERNKHGH